MAKLKTLSEVLTDLRAERDELKQRVANYASELTINRGTIDRLDEEGKLLRQQSAHKDHLILRLEARLDAALYAMVLMQNAIKSEAGTALERLSPLERTQRLEYLGQKAGWKHVTHESQAHRG